MRREPGERNGCRAGLLESSERALIERCQSLDVGVYQAKGRKVTGSDEERSWRKAQILAAAATQAGR